MIDAVGVADERVGDPAQLQQAIPIGIVPGQARDFQSEDDAHVGQRDFAGQTRKAGALVDAGAGQPQVFIDDHHLLFGPAQLASPAGQSVLASGGLAIVLDLAGRGLANVNVRGTLRMRQFDFR
jgi:hypothetical protein